MLGYRPEEMPTPESFIDWLLDRVHPDDRPSVDQACHAFLEGRTDRFRADVRMRHARGHWIHVRGESKAPEGGQDGRVRLLLGMMLDTSRIEESQAAEAFLAAVVAGSDDAIVSKRLDGTIRTWNAGAERLFGYSQEEAVGRSIFTLVPPERHAEEREILDRVRRGERIQSFETVRLTRDGRRIDVSLSLSRVLGEAGQVLAIASIARDITLRTQAVEAIRASEQRFRILADNITQLAWTCDRLGHATWYNRRWFEYTGSSLETMQGEGWKAVHHPDHVDRVMDGLRRALHDEIPWEDTFPLRGVDGRYRWFLSRAVPIRNEHDQVEQWFGTNTDITEHREAELRLVEAARHKDEFLAMLGHELRNPLAAIRAGTAILAARPAGDEQARRALAILERQGAHIGRLLDGLLDLSRMVQGQIHLEHVTLDVVALCREVMQDFRAHVTDDRLLQFDLDLPAGPVQVRGDRTRLAQVLDNLLANSLQHTPDGGTITVAVTVEGPRVAVAVRDTGTGIEPGLLPKIFDAFRQGPRPIVGRPGGLGLGLSLVKSLVESHDGDIEARSPGPSLGSQFIVRLPIAGATSPVPPDPGRHATEGRRILVIEDHGDAGEMMRDLLELDGHRVTVANQGGDGLAQARTLVPDIVLCDLGLPDRSGFDVARALRADAATRHIPLVAVSGYGRPEDKARSLEAGFDAHVTKPLEMAGLSQLLIELAS
jgi:PAS domain S-box-containing protein